MAATDTVHTTKVTGTDERIAEFGDTVTLEDPDTGSEMAIHLIETDLPGAAAKATLKSKVSDVIEIPLPKGPVCRRVKAIDRPSEKSSNP